jgi:hypothetical protein
MSHEPDPIDSATSDPAKKTEPALPVEDKSANKVSVVCDLNDGTSFSESYKSPHIPVLAAFGVGSLHVCRQEGIWDLDKAVAENAEFLTRSIHMLSAKNDMLKWDDLTFQFGPRSFLYMDMSRIVGFASTHSEALHLVTKFSKAYKVTPPPSGGSFHLLKVTNNDIRTASDSLGAETILGDEVLALHYGDEGFEWHRNFTEKLRENKQGLSIFEGTPGTGKTYYLRHLMGLLKESHRFYFIPTSAMGVLTSADFIDFWSVQRVLYSNLKFVVVLEDSDRALMTRGTDNREHVSAILNLTDGMLADFLSLQIICTINCTAADLDPALLRPGRLLCHRVFKRLEYSQAVRLAERVGRKLPIVRDYSIAEVFAGNEANEISRPRIGFAA